MNLTINNKIEDNTIPEHLKRKAKNLIHNNTKCNFKESNEDKSKTLFTLATQHLYNSLFTTNSHLTAKKIVVTGNVTSDGVGDYYHIIHTAEQIKKVYPNLKINVIPIIEASPFPSLKLLDPSKFKTLLCSSKAISEKALKKIKKADLVLEISYHISAKEYKDIVKCKSDENYKFIAEYGQSDDYSPQGKYACLSGMGVKNVELGIAIKDMPLSKSLLDLENNFLKQLLFNTAQPSKENLDNYLKNHEPFVAYLNAYSFFQMGFIYTVVALQENSIKTFIDIFMPEVDPSLLDHDYLKKHGVGKITIIKNSNDNSVEDQVKLAEEGKEIRFINLYPLNQNDLYTLMFHSNPLIGCTGDHSLSEVLSFHRTPFYEIRNFKKGFWQDMIKLAGEVGGDSYYLQQYFTELATIYDPQQENILNYHRMLRNRKELNERDYNLVSDYFLFYKSMLKDPKFAQAGKRIAKLLQTPEIYEEASQLSDLLKQQYNYNFMLKDIIARKFAHQAYPELQQYEKQLYDSFMWKGIDIVGVNTLLKQKIDSYR